MKENCWREQESLSSGTIIYTHNSKLYVKDIQNIQKRKMSRKNYKFCGNLTYSRYSAIYDICGSVAYFFAKHNPTLEHNLRLHFDNILLREELYF